MTDTRIVAHMVVRNEAGRYLAPCLRWLNTMVDAIHVYDDASTDATVDIAWEHGCELSYRRPEVPRFAVNEGAFREAGWMAMERAVNPQPGTWVLCVDADEFVVSGGSERAALVEAIVKADDLHADGVIFPVAEVFGREGDRMLVRRDGWWSGIRACRLVRYRPDGVFHVTTTGRPEYLPGSVPTYVVRKIGAEGSMAILHLGYLRSEDRQEKHERYRGDHIHNRRHVDSIVARPLLEPWEGKVPAGV